MSFDWDAYIEPKNERGERWFGPGMPYARLDSKTQTRVLCGVMDCGAELAHLDWSVSGVLMTLQFGAGWTAIGGHWRLTKHAKERIKRGLQPTLRRPKPTRPASNVEVLNVTIAECPTCGRCNMISAKELGADKADMLDKAMKR